MNEPMKVIFHSTANGVKYEHTALLPHDLAWSVCFAFKDLGQPYGIESMSGWEVENFKPTTVAIEEESA